MPSSSASATAHSNTTRAVSRKVIVGIFILISALYFADTLQRASLKDFWFDEIVSVLVCRLPSFGATWTAVMHGVDFNPPLFYILMRGGQHFFGEGLIASRLPAIVGFWIFGISLYFFVSRRLGPMLGCVAALFPVFTLAHAYAYEARPHGAVLGWCGLMLVCWQRAREGRTLSIWTLAFGLSWLAALLTHVYAIYLFVPFVAIEVLSVTKRWRLHAGILVALLIPPACVFPLYLRMSRAYRAATSVGGLHIHPYEVLQQYLLAVVGPALVILLLTLLLLSFAGTKETEPASGRTADPEQQRLLPSELWLAVGLACLPVFGAIGVKLSHGPFFNRYFLAGTAGYAILLAQAAASHGRRIFVAKGLVAAMLFLLVGDIGIAAYCRWRHADLDQIEPASKLHFSPDPHRPFFRDDALLRNHDPQPILVPNEHTYLYIYYYAPALRDRLYLGVHKSSAFSLAAFQEGKKWLRLNDLHAVGLNDFLATHRDFFIYSALDGNENGPCYDCLQPILDAGFALRSVDRDSDNLLEHFSK